MRNYLLMPLCVVIAVQLVVVFALVWNWFPTAAGQDVKSTVEITVSSPRDDLAMRIFVAMASTDKPVPTGRQPADHWRALAKEAFERADAFFAEADNRKSK